MGIIRKQPIVKIALLRGINVGTAKRLTMSDLRTLLEGLGYTNVKTLLNSGNAVFGAREADTATTARRIETALEGTLGVSAAVTVLDAAEIAAIMAHNPLRSVADNPSRMLVGILRNTADRGKFAQITKATWGLEEIALGTTCAVYMWMPAGVTASKLNVAVSKALGDGITSRNWSTMEKLRDMAATAAQ